MSHSTLSLPCVARWHSPKGYRPVVVVRRERKYLHVLALHRNKVRVEKLALIEEGLMWPLMRLGTPYPVARAKRRFRKMVGTFGVTKEARRALETL